MEQKFGFEMPYLIGGVPGEVDNPACAVGFACECEYSGCADSFDPDCGLALAISAIGAGVGIVIAIVPTNAAPG